MEKKIKKIMSEVLDIPELSINVNSSSKTIDQWDSLKQMNLIIALEEEFGIEFDDDEIGLSSYCELVNAIQKNKVV